ncbi:MAG TPA: hypothetical protein VFH51_09545, partial [Myxococcota bacterium]|nr:hypothetical protein [Myxococcota bacterium]
NGTVAGKALAPKDAIFSVATFSLDPNETGGLTISGKALVTVLGDQTGLCADATAQRQKKESAMLFTVLTTLNPATFEFSAGATGTYTVANEGAGAGGLTAGNLAIAGFTATDSACASTVTDEQSGATAGTVTLKEADASEGGFAELEFDLKMGSQADSISGKMTASYCAGLANLTTSFVTKTPPACQ